MRTTEKVATWLELAAAPHSQDRSLSVHVHPLEHDAGGRPLNCRGECCYAISFDGRWLHSGDGRLTVLKGVETVDRFMSLIQIPAVEPGEPVRIEVDCGKTAYCLAASRKAGLNGFA